MERGQVIRGKIIKNGKYTVKFMKESDNRNHIEVLEEGYGEIPTMSLYVDKDFGNHYYNRIKKASDEDSLGYVLEKLCLDSLAYNDDYDSYSDIYKDINGCRPHYTESQWKAQVKYAKSLKPEEVIYS